jgi:hypothetical protein
MSTEALNDRRQRAIEAFADEQTGRIDIFGTTTPDERLVLARDAAIETATRVQITDQMLLLIPATKSDALDIATDLFMAAGFEVEL